MKTAVPLLLAALLALPAAVHSQRSPLAGMGNPYKDPAQRSLDSCSRGLRLKRKGEKATDSEAKRKLYEKARQELSDSAAVYPNYDAFLALGEVYLALGRPDQAFTACSRAQRFKPGDEAAARCLEQVTAARQATAKEGA